MTDRTREINMLHDTLRILKKGYYEKNGKRIKLKLSHKEMEDIRVYLPESEKRNSSRQDFYPPVVIGRRCSHGCENIDAFSLARKIIGPQYLFQKDGFPVLVLNLANPFNPGGGVRNGARAQEEDLCRKSSLLFSLKNKEAQKYYKFNNTKFQ